MCIVIVDAAVLVFKGGGYLWAVSPSWSVVRRRWSGVECSRVESVFVAFVCFSYYWLLANMCGEGVRRCKV
jgi:hypothetical protein